MADPAAAPAPPSAAPAAEAIDWAGALQSLEPTQAFWLSGGLILLWGLSWIVSRVLLAVFASVAKKTETQVDDEVVRRIGPPFRLALLAAFTRVVVLLLSVPPVVQRAVERVVELTVFVAFFWGLLRLLDVGAAVLKESRVIQNPGVKKTLIPLGSRVAKVAVVAVGVVAVLSELGYPVASLLAGLGIGGLAVALAAQRTFENLFGAFVLGIDEPFHEGDFVQFDGLVGTVERVGLRSTRVRTADRTVVTMPNGRLAEQRIETFAERDRIRLHCKVGLMYSTKRAQMVEVIAGLEAAARAHEKIWPDAVHVRFLGFGDSSLDLEVICWFQTRDFVEFCKIRNDLLLDFMAVVERAGAGFAFPTRTLHVEPLRVLGGAPPA